MSFFCKCNKVTPSTHNSRTIMVCGGALPPNIEDSSLSYLSKVIECLRKVTAKIPREIYNSLKPGKKIK